MYILFCSDIYFYNVLLVGKIALIFEMYEIVGTLLDRVI